MIEFNGEISQSCRCYIIKKQCKYARICMTIVSAVFCIPIIVLTIVWDWIFIIAIPALILGIILAGVKPKEKSYPLIFPDRIIINNDCIESESTKFHETKSMNQVKKVVDMGDWYHIFFNDHLWNSRFVCQKDLIKQGTIEEFENVFQDKIVKSDANKRA